MKRYDVRPFYLLSLMALLSCYRQPSRDTISQLSTYDALLSGFYDGSTRCRDLLKWGDFGIGTFNHLDGEMVIVDGIVHQVRHDGKVIAVADSVLTPYADVCFFCAEQTKMVDRSFDFRSLQAFLDSTIANPNLFYAIRVQALFSIMMTRSVAAQQKPYPPLVEVAKKQSVFNMAEVKGTLVGFRFPTFSKGINVPGYHFHFISDDRKQGGHVLDCRFSAMQLQIDQCRRFQLTLPEAADFNILDLGRDTGQETRKVMTGK